MTELAELFVDLPDALQAGIRDLGWHEPMPVQAKTIPLLREEAGDLIVQAQTGSGKTGAFGIPMVEAVDTELAATQALVLVPTRELANQVAGEISILGKHLGVRCLPVYGGVGYGPQLEGLAKGAHVVVGTPGRILDHLGSGRMKLDAVRVLVLDEADEMLSLGFWPDMREIRSYLPEPRQTHLFSATIPEKVRSLSRWFQSDAQFVSLSADRLAPQQIEHFFYVVSAQEKEKMLARIIEYEDPESAIVFCNTKADVRYVASFLQKRDLDAAEISGDLAQAAREEAIGRLKAGKLRFLVATDVAARGIDISDLTCVISYSTPDSPEIYVHRTGRTGRAGKAGIALSLVSGFDIGNFHQLQKVNRIDIAERKVPTEAEILERVRERLEVKVEQELRSLSESQRSFQVERLVPIVEKLAATAEGRRDLAGICAAYLREHRPVTTVTAPTPRSEPEPREGGSASDDSGRRRRRPRRRGGRSRG